MSYLSERQCQLCGQRSCFNRAQTAWPADEQRSTPTEGHTSWRVSICLYTVEMEIITSRVLERLTLRNLTQHFVRSGNWRLVSFVFVIVVRHVP